MILTVLLSWTGNAPPEIYGLIAFACGCLLLAGTLNLFSKDKDQEDFYPENMKIYSLKDFAPSQQFMILEVGEEPKTYIAQTVEDWKKYLDASLLTKKSIEIANAFLLEYPLALETPKTYALEPSEQDQTPMLIPCSVMVSDDVSFS